MSTHPCLYCIDLMRPRTAEHVLQRGLGANMTLPDDVCDDCNSKVFSPMDGHLINFVRQLVYAHHPHMKGQRTIIQDLGLMLDTETQTWLTIRLDKKYAPIVLTQIVFLAGGNVGVFLDATMGPQQAQQMDQIRKELSNPGGLKFSRSIIAGQLGQPGQNLPALQPALVRSAANTYVVRAADEEQAAKVEAAVQSGALGKGEVTGERRGQSREMAHMNLALSVGDIERAVAKTALNYVCSVIGPDVARRSAFDPIRQFAHAGTGGGFVTFVFGQDPAKSDPTFAKMAAGFTKQGKHTLALQDPDGHPMVLMILYERPFAVIRLTQGQARGALPADSMAATLFDYQARTHETVKLMGDPEAFARRFGFI